MPGQYGFASGRHHGRVLFQLCAHLQRQWAGRRSNPRLRFFRPPLYHLSYQPNVSCGHEKRPAVFRDTGPCSQARVLTRRHKRMGYANSELADCSASQPLPWIPKHMFGDTIVIVEVFRLLTEG
mgnify:CR=1 FL=1